MSGRIIHLEPYKDPDEFIKNLGAEQFRKRMEQAENSFLFELRILERDFDLSDPDGKTKFQQEIARKLCGFSEAAERENYIEAVAEKYHMSFESLRSLVGGYAAKEGFAGGMSMNRPMKAAARKSAPRDGARWAQRLLITWLSEEPGLYDKIKKYISPRDFTIDLYREVAKRLFETLEQGSLQPASIISQFEDEEQQREAAALFHSKLPQMALDKKEREKAFHDILVRVKTYSYEYDSAHMGSDIDALSRAVSGKKDLEQLKKTHISLD